MGAIKAKPVKKVVKKPVQPQDTSLLRVRKWFDKNYTLVVGVSAAVLFTIISVWGFISHDRSKHAHAMAAYGLISSRLPAEGKGTPADWEKIIPELQKFIEEYKDTGPALNARVELAKAFFEVKRCAEAAKTGEEALKLASPGHGLKPLIMYQLGYAYECAGKIDEAADMWSRLKQLGMPELEREADWNLAGIFKGKGDFTKAAEMYQAASRAQGNYPSTDLIDEELGKLSSTK